MKSYSESKNKLLSNGGLLCILTLLFNYIFMKHMWQAVQAFQLPHLYKFWGLSLTFLKAADSLASQAGNSDRLFGGRCSTL